MSDIESGLLSNGKFTGVIILVMGLLYIVASIIDNGMKVKFNDPEDRAYFVVGGVTAIIGVILLVMTFIAGKRREKRLEILRVSEVTN